MIIGLFGLSGSGKTTIRQEFSVKYKNFFCTSASDLLKKVQCPTNYQFLNNNILYRNQVILLKEYKELIKLHQNVFIELHALIETSTDSFYLIEENILTDFKLDLIFLLDSSSKEIRSRRLNDQKYRFLSDQNKIESYRTIQFNYLNRIYKKKLNIIHSFEDIKLLYRE